MTNHLDPEAEKTLGELIREARTAKGVSLRQLATHLGCSAPFLSDVEHGRRNASRFVDAIAEHLGIDGAVLKAARLRHSIAYVQRHHPEVYALLEEMKNAPHICPHCVRYGNGP